MCPFLMLLTFDIEGHNTNETPLILNFKMVKIVKPVILARPCNCLPIWDSKFHKG